MYPGVAQLVARLLWEQDAVGSSPATRTKIPLKSLILGGFSYFFVYCGENSMVFAHILNFAAAFDKMNMPEDCLCFGMIPAYVGIFLLINLRSFWNSDYSDDVVFLKKDLPTD